MTESERFQNPPSPCPCPRPPGLTDSEVRSCLDLFRGGGVGPLVYSLNGTWHVDEWRRCDAELWTNGSGPSGWDRCALHLDHYQRRGATEHHTGSFAFSDRHERCRFRAEAACEPSWPVPCWVTTAEEAERWRPVTVADAMEGVEAARRGELGPAAARETAAADAIQRRMDALIDGSPPAVPVRCTCHEPAGGYHHRACPAWRRDGRRWRTP